MKNSRWFRFCAVALSATLFLSATAAGLKPAVSSSARWIGLLLQGRPPQFTQRPGPIYYGPNPTRDPEFRGGIWTPATRLDLASAQEKWQRQQRREEGEDVSLSGLGWLYAIAGPTALWMQPVPGGEGGGQMPGQGNLPGGGFYGGTVNSATGNLNYPVPLFSIPVRGGMSMGLTLYHNSQTGFVGMFGEKWSSTWEMRVTDETSSVIVRWPDGLTVPYNPLPGGGYDPPPGIHDELVKNQDQTWTVTTKDQTQLNFGTDGKMTSIVDRNGNTITLAYSNGDLVSVTSPTGQIITFGYQTFSEQRRRCTSASDGTRTWTFSYDDNMNFTRLQTIHYPVVEAEAFSTSFTYDSAHNLLTETDPKGKVWRWTYAGTSNVIETFKDPLLNTWTYTFTASDCSLQPPENTSTQTIRHNYSNGLLVSVVDPANFSVSMQYDSDRNVTHFTDARGHLWRMTYDGTGNLTSVKNPFPFEKTWSFTWNASNDLETATDPLSHTWTLAYYPDGNLKEIWDPMSPSRRRALVGPYTNGLPSHVKDALDKQWTLGYDPNGYLNSITNPENETVSAVYDSLGRIKEVTNGEGETTKIYYDEWSRVKRIEHPDLEDIHYAYDAASNLTSVTDERDKVTTFAYDDAHRLIGVTRVNNGENETESYGYDDNNRLTSVTNGNGKTRTYSYNVRGELYSISLPDLSTEYFSYDGDGNLTLYTHPEGFQIGYVYDNAGRLTKIDYPTGVDTTFGYDDASRLTQMVDSTGTTTWGYNNADQVTSLAQPAGTITYDYDDNARLWKMHQPGSLTTTYTYDFAWRLKTITNGFGEQTSFDYDDASRVIKKTFANGTYETYSYDPRSRVEWIRLFNSSQQQLSSHGYTYDPASNVETRTDNGTTTTFGYDDIGQLISESRTGYSATYSYDKNGNRLTRTLDTGSGPTTEVYAYDDADKLLNVKVNGNVVKSFSYDLAGRTTGITTPAGTTSFNWDLSDRLVQITYPDQSVNTFTYNGAGARVARYDSTGSHIYLRTAATPWGDIVDDSAAVYTPSISERRNGETRFYHFGAHGEKWRETDSDQNTGATSTWDAWGNSVSESGSSGNLFGFLGAFGFETDPDSAFTIIGVIEYDSSTGRSLKPPSRSGVGGDGRSNWGGPGGTSPGSGRPFVGPSIERLATPYLDGKPNDGFDATPWWQRALDAMYDLPIGWGDGVSGGLTFELREWMGTNDYVDFDSGAYKVGVGIGVANGVAIDVGAAATAARATRGVAGAADEVAEAVACFVAGTHVVMADGTTKPIEEIEEGDLVLSRSEGGAGTVARPVTQTFSRSASQTTTVRFEGGGEVVTTAEHPFWVEGDGWTPASRLTPADNVATPDGTLRVTSVMTTGGAQVYNFEVSGTHTYFVVAKGEAVWVHNACRGRNHLKPHPDAVGPHTAFRRDPQTGRITHYEEFTPNPKNPSGFDTVKRFDGVGDAHGRVPTPHIHDKKAPGGVRPPRPDELPRGYR